jgi:hypothetical protein
VPRSVGRRRPSASEGRFLRRLQAGLQRRPICGRLRTRTVFEEETRATAGGRRSCTSSSTRSSPPTDSARRAADPQLISKPRTPLGGLVAITLATTVAVPVAQASQTVARNAVGPRLHVDGSGRALVTFERAGRPVAVLAWGAVNALPPTSGTPQTSFRLDYAARRRYGAAVLRRQFRNGCRDYDGPGLVWLVAACKAPDGSYWALQAWQRLQPMRGIAPFRPQHSAVELHLSHWTGPLPVLEVSPNWTYGGSWQGLFGRLTYAGVPVYKAPSPMRPNRYQRYAYIDTYNSAYGPGWKRDAAKATHVGNGAFCYSFVPQKPPPGYPTSEPRGPGNGERHRVTVMGPGVTPIVQWEGAGLGGYDPVRDQLFNSVFDRFLSGDRVCVRER